MESLTSPKTWTARHNLYGWACTVSNEDAQDRLIRADTKDATVYPDGSFDVGDWHFTPDFVVGADELPRALGWLWCAA